MRLEITGPRERYQPARLGAPTPHGYVHLAAKVDPPRGPIPLVPRSAAREALFTHLRPLADTLRRTPGVLAVTLYRAVLLPQAGAMPPGLEVAGGASPTSPDASADLAGAVGGVSFDVAVLVTTDTVEGLPVVMASRAYRDLVAALAERATAVQEVAARCARRVGDVDQVRPGGIYIFNHFRAEDPAVALELWQHIAGWYAAETGLDNSIVLEPLAPAPYTFVNHARWDCALPTLARRQFGKASFRTYVLANLRAHHVVAMPGLYRLA
jgi:hypothetical protein